MDPMSHATLECSRVMRWQILVFLIWNKLIKRYSHTRKLLDIRMRSYKLSKLFLIVQQSPTTLQVIIGISKPKAQRREN